MFSECSNSAGMLNAKLCTEIYQFFIVLTTLEKMGRIDCVILSFRQLGMRNKSVSQMKNRFMQAPVKYITAKLNFLIVSTNLARVLQLLKLIYFISGHRNKFL